MSIPQKAPPLVCSAKVCSATALKLQLAISSLVFLADLPCDSARTATCLRLAGLRDDGFPCNSARAAMCYRFIKKEGFRAILGLVSPSKSAASSSPVPPDKALTPSDTLAVRAAPADLAGVTSAS